MRLADMQPKWVTLSQWASADPFYIGVSFLCPHCPREPCPTCGHDQSKRIAVTFWPPIDPKGLLGSMFNLPDNGGHRRTAGETFDTLSLFPSVGLDPHWHGHIIAGELT